MVTFTRVLCPIDFSEPSRRALAYARAFAEWHQARLAVMHVAAALKHHFIDRDGLISRMRPGRG